MGIIRKKALENIKKSNKKIEYSYLKLIFIIQIQFSTYIWHIQLTLKNALKILLK